MHTYVSVLEDVFCGIADGVPLPAGLDAITSSDCKVLREKSHNTEHRCGWCTEWHEQKKHFQVVRLLVDAGASLSARQW